MLLYVDEGGTARVTRGVAIRIAGLEDARALAVAQSLYRSEGLTPQTHALYPGGREVLWAKQLGAEGGPA
jgi:hypothetical protein